MALFKRPEEQEMSPRETLERRYAVARRDILILLGFTAFNLFLLLTKSNLYFLFSAYLPHMLVDLGMLMCGMHPKELYEELYDAPYHSLEFTGKGFFFLMLLLAVFVLVWYLISWLCTKKKISAGWLIFTLVYFGVDTLVMVIKEGFSREMIFNYVFHGWMIYSLVSGILAVRRLKNWEEE